MKAKMGWILCRLLFIHDWELWAGAPVPFMRCRRCFHARLLTEME